MSTVDNEVTPDPQAAPATAAPEELDLEDSGLEEGDEELEESDSLLGPIVGAESMGITSLLLSFMTFFGIIGQWFRFILIESPKSQGDEIALNGKGYAIGGLLVLVFTVIGHLQIRSHTPRWAKGILGSTTLLGLLFLIIGIVLFWRSGDYPASPGA